MRRIFTLQCVIVVICTTACGVCDKCPMLLELEEGTFDALPDCMSSIPSWIWPRSFGFAPCGVTPSTRDCAELDLSARSGARRGEASAKKPVRHLFVVELLGENRKYRAYDYYYRCARCHWLFMVDRHGGVVAMSDRDRLLPINQGNYRVRTFAHGPCAVSSTEGSLSATSD
jgi:hypothetical protein